ncbi:hypothetical protein [uncultured Kocuria sp.]|uniref:hypothetical protein n=1 Tax=uncultured Kocuria sp. TaxID=259305 RepID=UPI0025976E1F|nr:hypothetical protein [uncultured Kocuria sp.]
MAYVKLKNKGMREMLKSAEIQAGVNRHAGRIARNAGDGYEAKESKMREGRARAVVLTADPDAIRDNSRNQTLSRVR